MIALAFSSLATTAHAQTLAPYKDELFAYPAILSSEGETYRVVDYQEMRDINERDQVPEWSFVKLAIFRVRSVCTQPSNGGEKRRNVA